MRVIISVVFAAVMATGAIANERAAVSAPELQSGMTTSSITDSNRELNTYFYNGFRSPRNQVDVHGTPGIMEQPESSHDATLNGNRGPIGYSNQLK
jgi:hypothetical protein